MYIEKKELHRLIDEICIHAPLDDQKVDLLKGVWVILTTNIERKNFINYVFKVFRCFPQEIYDLELCRAVAGEENFVDDIKMASQRKVKPIKYFS